MSSVQIQINTFKASSELIQQFLGTGSLNNLIKCAFLLDYTESYNEETRLIGESLAISFEVKDLEDEKSFLKSVKLLNASLIHVSIFYDQVGEETARYFQGNKLIAKKNIQKLLIAQDPKETLMFATNINELPLFESALISISKIDGSLKHLFMRLIESGDFSFLAPLVERIDSLVNVGITSKEHPIILQVLLKTQNIIALTKFVDLGLSVACIDDDGNNALMIAGYYKCPKKLFVYLLDKQVSVSQKNKYGDTPIHSLFKSNDFRDNGLLSLTKRYEENGADFFGDASDGSSLLWHCYDQPLTKSYLVSKNVELKRPTGVYDGDTRLSIALKHNDDEAINALLNEENVKREKDLLYLAYRLRKIHLIKPLLELGASPEEKPSGHKPFFNRLFEGGEYELAKLLLDFGLDKDISVDPALTTVISDNRLSLDRKLFELKWLIDAGAKLEQSSYISSYGIVTPLTLAVQENNYEIVEFLLKNNANPNAVPKLKNSFSYSPLIEAVEKNNEPLARLLIESGACVNYFCNDSWQTSALFSAVAKRNIDIIKLLLSNKADIYHEANAPSVRKPIIEYAKKFDDVYSVFEPYL